jgi:hypothetical protein
LRLILAMEPLTAKRQGVAVAVSAVIVDPKG